MKRRGVVGGLVALLAAAGLAGGLTIFSDPGTPRSRTAAIGTTDVESSSTERVYLTIDGVSGPETAKYKGAIALKAARWKVLREASALRFEDLSVAMAPNKTSPTLVLAAIEGRRFQAASIAVTRQTEAGEVEYISVSLSDVAVTVFSTSGATRDEMSLAFGRIVVTHRQLDSSGKVSGEATAGWDVRGGAKV